MDRKNYKTVVHIADFAAPYPGNFFASLNELEQKMSDKDLNVIYILPKRASNRDWIKSLEGKKQIIFLTDKFLKDINIISRVLEEFKVDIIHTHFCWLKYNILIKIANAKRKAKIIRHVHSMYIESTNIIGKIKRQIFDADLLIPCSDEVKLGLIKSGFNVNKIKLIKNSINFERLDYYEKLTKQEIGIPNKSRSILMFGHDFYVKGVDIALNAINKLNSEIENKVYIIIPISNKKDEIESKIISVLGYLPIWVKIVDPRNDIATYINFTDVVLSASRSEGFSYALVESAYCKSNIIYSDIKVHCDLGLKSAVPFISENAHSLYDVIKNYINHGIKVTDDDLEEQKKYVINSYSLSRWVESVLKAYELIWEE